ncbi:bifunctional UDP-N-acetylglucosamine diphosphorylase/glucosamine-1-phosphate N-acetyltransferase GlmU [Helcococcus kunzii]|uniref:bifunctional UDP-N-acetylglucosamine diphosphorylase/glucosamine-1-phosphate N-acetyltransferase GlmU n=1 Tax=Helcococcus kunzii TaxID=40091 RepID=UPI001BB05707|nr:bifunctional UDP-N-acetylglucosamine diphosphorylase/glucosamine-1-phosphate N-acetyltransferase GlmU [Helcococcus kunzii]MCT1796740.1 bifunctional UDP-N-acetylglucosamine diphosphorylase/glucosamine-1-phosphate N-acetyltransferase GlmU [Helcococcus kunzii]MCT1988872.1 bifunctional UDP-N-acetylglucosamine diphosphorylase/glucosamine-1-phosphate N-acetyltransferase GlmU [Helcococcus kunzii]QUY64517.1 bifunctional UDP-N-acetylglucosamine diphosphorylase/glucosamine-1-phosphate N-acetyltransfera
MNKVIILAAGEGTRMKSNISKVLHKICNKSILSYVIDASKEANFDEIYVIVGKNEEAVKDEFKDSVKYIKQEIGPEFPYGTGYAVKLAEKYIEDEDNILVLSGDAPLIKGKTLADLVQCHIDQENEATVVSAIVDNPFGYGRIISDENGQFKKIVEHKDCNDNEILVKEINSGMYLFNGDKLKYALNKLDTNNVQGEMYLTDVFGILEEEKLKISTYKVKDNTEINGINTKLQLAEAEKIMRKRINEAYMLEGVILENPETITIEKGVLIGKDTVIEQNVKLLGDTVIGENCLIGMNSRLINAKIGKDVIIYSSFIEDAIVEDNVDMGPFARLRPKAHIKSEVHIGNFVEVKNAILGEGTKAGHLAYIGDAELGKNINVSCGVIFANYDGKKKHKTIVGDDAFLGSNVNIVAPVHIANKAFLAAGSTITRDVEEGQLSVERAEQRNIDGYYERKFGNK